MMRKNLFSINGRFIGPNYEPYIIAEMSANHNGSVERAIQIIEMCKKMGADAVKIQSYTADTITIDSNNEDFLINEGLWKGHSLHSLYKWAETPNEWHTQLFKRAKEIGITLFSTPFDETAVDLLEDLDVPAYKVASFEIVDLPLIKYIAKTGKPMILSTGMANADEIKEAVEVARENGCESIALLHCISSYPAPIEQSNLRTIEDLRQKFNVVAGLSDHTLGTIVATTAVALGASIIEKHVKLNDYEDGPDSDFSLLPMELKELCSKSKEAWQALGERTYKIQEAEMDSLKFRRSLYAIKDITIGEKITTENVKSIRPGYGLAPKHYESILGKKAKCDLTKGTSLSWEYIE
jgi:pseudaminic acid synthase